MTAPPRVFVVIVVLAAFLLLVRSAGVLLDFSAAISFPFEFDYGEGIVWQQAALFGTPSMYAVPDRFPFLVFHYPPVYYVLVRAAGFWMGDLLQAGRAVSIVSTLVTTVLAGALVWRSCDITGRGRLVICIATGLVLLCSANVWTWGLLMRVDMVAIALSFAGLWVAQAGQARFGRVVLALALCAAAVFTKQLQFSAGIAVVLVSLIRAPRPTFIAIVFVAGASLLWFMWLQRETAGGFGLNVIASNVNRFSILQFIEVLRIESRDGLSLGLGVAGSIAVGLTLLPLRDLARRVRTDPAVAARAMAITHYGCCFVTLAAAAKEGSNANYFIEFLSSGMVLAGVAGGLLLRRAHWRWLGYQAVIIAIIAVSSPWRIMPAFIEAEQPDAQWRLVEQVRSAAGPVSSENMTILMRAGKAVLYEPAIVTQFAKSGVWDETPLLQMIEKRAFAFMVTSDRVAVRTPAVDAAMRAAYPTREWAAPGLWLHYPAVP